MKILSDRLLHIRVLLNIPVIHVCVYRPSRSADEKLHNNAPDRKCLRKKTTACVSLFVLFRVRRGTFLYSI